MMDNAWMAITLASQPTPDYGALPSWLQAFLAAFYVSAIVFMIWLGIQVWKSGKC